MDPVHEDVHRFAPAAPHEDHVFGACAPGWHTAAEHPTAIEQWVSFMRERDIERVCCLLQMSHSEAMESGFGAYQDAFGSENVKHVPMADRRLVDPDRVRTDVFPFIEASVEADERVVVHGLSGLGRTGQVLAAWLVSHHEYRPHDAVDTVMEMGRDPSIVVDFGAASRHELLDMLGEFR
jgi:protein-tyrosine phosphatase